GHNNKRSLHQDRWAAPATGSTTNSRPPPRCPRRLTKGLQPPTPRALGIRLLRRPQGPRSPGKSAPGKFYGRYRETTEPCSPQSPNIIGFFRKRVVWGMRLENAFFADLQLRRYSSAMSAKTAKINPAVFCNQLIF